MVVSSSLKNYIRKLVSLNNYAKRLDEAVKQLTSANIGFQQHVTLVEEQSKEGLNETRRSLRVLRSVEVQRVHGLLAINRLIKAFGKATRIEVNVDFGNLPWTLGEPIDLVMYRLVQEGMTNAFRHGKSTRIEVHFFQSDSSVNIYIHDNGSGSTEIKEGIGLLGMRERIERLGGSITAHNRVDGFELSASIPCKSKV